MQQLCLYTRRLNGLYRVARIAGPLCLLPYGCALADDTDGWWSRGYALEAFAPAYGRPVARQVERCRDLQESLGVLQDAAVFASQLKGLRTFVAGQFIATMRARADGHLQELPAVWDRAFPSKGMARLGGHLLRRAVKSPKRPEAPAAADPLAASGT